MCAGIGNTDYDAINAVGLNDQFSSVKVPTGLAVTAYEHSNFYGEKRVYLEDTNWIGIRFNDVISSFVVSPAEVCFYQHGNYGGEVMCKGLGRTSYEEINGRGLNDQFSSVKVFPGLSVTAYEHDFTGRSKALTEDTAWIGDDFNDIISSFDVSLLKVCFYQHSYYEGEMMCAGIGDTDYRIINDRSLNDQFSSVRVPLGLRVTAYEHDFTGGSRVYVNDIDWLGNFNDIISSFKVEKV